MGVGRRTGGYGVFYLLQHHFRKVERGASHCLSHFIMVLHCDGASAAAIEFGTSLTTSPFKQVAWPAYGRSISRHHLAIGEAVITTTGVSLILKQGQIWLISYTGKKSS